MRSLVALLLLLASCPAPEDCLDRNRSPSQVQDRYLACMLELEQLGYPDTDNEPWQEICLEQARCF